MPTPAKTIFAVFGATDPAALDARIASAFPGSFQIVSGQWLVASPIPLAADIYKVVSRQETEHLLCIIAPMSSYYGWQNKAVWNWIEAVGRGE